MKSRISFWRAAGIVCFLTFGTTKAQPLVTYPNGGEKLTVGSSVKITWTGTLLNTEVAIDYTINNWSKIVWITTSYQNPLENSYIWTVPNTPGTQCMVGVFDANSSGDISNNFFTIKAASDIDNFAFAQTVDVYPNPTTDILYISSTAGSRLSFKLFDMSGKESIIEASEEGDGNYRIEKGSLQNGIYTLLISNEENGSFLRRKIIID